MSEVSDADLIQQCLAGKQAAWEILLARYERLIYYTAHRSGAHADEVADVFQAVVLIWLEQLGRLRNPQRLGAWLVTTTRRECWSRWKRAREVEEDPEETLAEQAAPDELPEALAAQAEDARAVNQAVEQLAEFCRSLIRLLYYDLARPSYAEIARKLNMPINSLGPMRTRCLAKLRDILRRMGW